MSYEEEDTCMPYAEEDKCTECQPMRRGSSACRASKEEDTCMTYEEEDTCGAAAMPAVRQRIRV